MTGDEQDSNTRVTVYRFGAPTRGGQRAFKLSPTAEQQMLLAHRLQNAFVERWLDREAAVQEIWSSYPQVAAVEERLAATLGRLEEASAALARAKVQQQTKRPTGPAAEAVKMLRAEAKNLRTERKAARDAIKLDAKERLGQVEDAFRASVKALYAEVVQEGGLYWATYNDVIAHMQTAAQRVMATRKAGRPATLRFRRWDGSATITVQLQRGAGDPVRTPAMLSSDEGKWRNVLQVKPWIPPDEHQQMTRAEQRQAGRGTVIFGLGSKLPAVEVPVQVHRMLPETADVTMARLTGRRMAGRTLYSVSVTARVPKTAPKEGGPTIAVHLGWRRLDEVGTIRVAAWRADAAVEVPGHLRDVVVAHNDHAGIVVLPARWRDQLNSANKVRSDRDKMLDEMRDRLVEWLTTHPQPLPAGEDEQEAVTAARVKVWRSPGRFAALAKRWRDEAPPVGDGGGQIAAELESWRVCDRKLWEREANGRGKAVGRRTDAYRRVAAWIASVAGMLVVDDTDLAALSRRAKSSADELPTVVAERSASQRVDAAPGELRAAAVAAAERDGLKVVTLSHKGLTLVHHVCGWENPPDERWAKSAEVVCDQCGRRYDQDANATVNMLAAAVD